MFHLAAYYQQVDPAGAYVQVTPIADAVLTVNSPKILVPSLNQIILAAGGAESTVLPRMRLVAPSMLTMFRNQITPLNTAAAAAVVPLSPQRVMNIMNDPIQLVQGEALTVELFSDPAAAQYQWGLVWLADKVPAPINGKVFTARATVAGAATANVWSLQNLTFDDTLPRGRYSCVGFRAFGPSVVAARLLFVGQAWRPGCLGSILVGDYSHEVFRWGNMGEWGQFEDIDAVQVETLCNAADAAANMAFFLDLVQVRAGNS